MAGPAERRMPPNPPVHRTAAAETERVVKVAAPPPPTAGQRPWVADHEGLAMPTITVIYPDGRSADIDPRGDGHGRVLIGSAECCQIRLAGADVLPIHAY